MTVGIGALLALMAWKLVPLMIDALKGTPPIEQLRQVDGEVAAWRPCRSVGRNKRVEQVTLSGQGRTETVELPCMLPGSAGTLAVSRHMTVLLKDDELVGPIVLDVRYDFRHLLSYAEEKHRRDRAVPFIVGACILALAIVGALFVFLVRRCRLTLRD